MLSWVSQSREDSELLKLVVKHNPLVGSVDCDGFGAVDRAGKYCAREVIDNVRLNYTLNRSRSINGVVSLGGEPLAEASK